MKHHFNFIKSVSADRQREINRWTKISLLLLGLVFIALIVTTSRQLLELHDLYEEHTYFNSKAMSFSKTSDTHAQLKKEIARYKKKLEKINQIQATNTAPITYIKAVVDSLPSGTALQSINCTGKTMDISLLCIDTATAPVVMEKLALQPYFEKLKLATLQPNSMNNKAGFVVTIQGKIKN